MFVAITVVYYSPSRLFDIVAVFWVLLYVPPLFTVLKQLIYPVDAIVVNETGVLFQCFYSSPGQLFWADFNVQKQLFDYNHLISFGTEGFYVTFKDQEIVGARKGLLKRIYFRLGCFGFAGKHRITLPTGTVDVAKFYIAVEYFRGEWEKKQQGDQKAQEEKKREEEREKRLERRWEVAQSGGRDLNPSEENKPLIMIGTIFHN